MSLTESPAYAPPYIPVGHSVRLVAVPEIARQFGMTLARTLAFLRDFQIPILYTGPDPGSTNPADTLKKTPSRAYVNLFSLESVLFRVLTPQSILPTEKNRPGLLAFLQSCAALEYASLDKEALKARLHEWVRRFQKYDRRKRKAELV